MFSSGLISLLCTCILKKLFHYNVKDILQNYLFLKNIVAIMQEKMPQILPTVSKMLSGLGENIKLARLRRRLSAEQVAERANISRPTLHSIEKGIPGVAIGSYAQVLFVLNLEKDLLKIAMDDTLGRKLQDIGLTVKKRAPKK
jgi:DNA-binding XRE family transcriptional regulator